MSEEKNIEKIKMCMTHNMPNNVELVCMVREDFERNFGNDYISKDKIKEILNNTEKNIEEDRPSIVLENLILNIKELLGE